MRKRGFALRAVHMCVHVEHQAKEPRLRVEHPLQLLVDLLDIGIRGAAALLRWHLGPKRGADGSAKLEAKVATDVFASMGSEENGYTYVGISLHCRENSSNLSRSCKHVCVMQWLKHGDKPPNRTESGNKETYQHVTT